MSGLLWVFSKFLFLIIWILADGNYFKACLYIFITFIIHIYIHTFTAHIAVTVLLIERS